MSEEDVLHGLDAVDWGALSHAFGPAADVPELLRKLISANPDDRWEAYDELTNTVWHQGTVYSASPRVVPYLIAMLRSPQTPDRRLPAVLLALLADGSSGLEVHATGDSPVAARMRAWLVEGGRNLESELAEERRWVEETRLAVREALPLLVPFLGDEQTGVREAIVLGLARYPERAEGLLLPLRAAQGRESDEDLRETIAQAIAALGGAGEQ